MRSRISCIAVVLATVEILLLAAAVRSTGLSADASPRIPGQRANLARHRPYTLDPPPNYAPTTDPDDSRQLTDEVYSAGRLWTQRGTVGWTNVSRVTVVIDLGSVQPISGVSFDTAAGTADVEWPRSLFVLVSDDGREFFPVADLAALSDAPETPRYRRFLFATHSLRTHGRYVAVMVDPSGPFAFCDEIEVYAGDPDWVTAGHPETPVTDLGTAFNDARTRVAIQRRLTADLDAARATLRESAVPERERLRLQTELDVLAREISTLTPSIDGTFRAVLPLNATHARIFAARGSMAALAGRPPLSAWATGPWDFLRPTEAPSNALTRVSIAAMSGETRSGAVNLSNSTDRPLTVTLRLTVAGDRSFASGMHLYEVVWTDTRESIPVADALVPLGGAEGTLVVPAGMTRQIWISVTPPDGQPRTVHAMLTATAGDGSRTTVPVDVQVLRGSFPTRFHLHLGGWDYTNRESFYGLTSENAAPLLRALQRLGVDAPWATREVMPTRPAGGNRRHDPDTSRFDQWVSSWPGASRYLIFIDAADRLGDVRVADDGFRSAVSDWIAFWAAHAATLGIAPSQLGLLIVDEPKTADQAARVVAWAEAIRGAKTGVKIWENPNFPEPERADAAIFDLSDIVAVERSLMDRHGTHFAAFFQRRRARGQVLDVYNASGPVRLLDPYTYHRLQAWVAADVGASASFFWSFIDGAGSWNEYAAPRTTYSPFFLSSRDVTISKHSEAILEGQEDVEYLTMLRDRVASLTAASPNHPGLSEARRLLETAAARVLHAAGASDMRWIAQNDHLAADQVRLEIANALVRLDR